MVIRYFREYLQHQDKIYICSDLDLPQSQDKVKNIFSVLVNLMYPK